MKDVAFEALAEVTATDWDSGRGELNAALKAIRLQTPEIDDDALLGAEIEHRARLYREVMPDVMLTPPALAKHWQRVVEESHERHKPKGTNLKADKDCQTCGGDRFVVVSLRKPMASAWMKERGIEPHAEEMFEEMAPCPDCGPVVRGTPDPAKTRQMMSR